VLSNPDPNDLRIKYSRHLMFNLSRPEKSLILLAPLAQAAGGYGLCREEDVPRHSSSVALGAPHVPSDEGRAANDGRQEPIFADTNDPDYQKILALCRAGRQHLEEIKRFDMPGFRPDPTYIREMKRFGVLPADLAPDAPIDVYATDRAYWRSLWWQPAPPRAAGALRNP
jgi:rhodanese-related sulfurtransferase